MSLITKLLPKVKANLILDHNEDDKLLKDLIRAAVDYAQNYQHKPDDYYYTTGVVMPSATEEAIIITASHLYESRDGSTAGFFADSTSASAQTWDVVRKLLLMGKDWMF